MNQLTVRLRCVAVACGVTGLLAALTAFLLPNVGAAVAHVRAGGATAEPFDDLLVTGCAVAALLAACWLWAATCLVALRAAFGHPVATTRGVPPAVRRLLMVACGVALAGTATVPAAAASGTAGGIGGLPFPDRATGAASVASAPVARLPRAGRAVSARPARPVDAAVVRPGDTLWALAARHLPPGAGPAAVTACWQRIHELNRDVIGDDPDLIRPGQRLRLPRR